MAEPDGDILTLDEVAAYLKAGKRTIWRDEDPLRGRALAE